MFGTVIAITAGFLTDYLIGDPQWRWHPIRLIGNLVSVTEKISRRLFPVSKNGELAGGAVMTLVVAVVSFLVPAALLAAAEAIHPYFRIVLETLFCYMIQAARGLKTESMRVYGQLEKKDLAGARKALSWIVGRDTAQLDEKQVAKATVETVAENTTDGVVAPLLFMAIGGAPLGFFYKAINTMDSMVGYKNDRYLYFGRVAAKLDDAVNWIPARVSAWLMIAASALNSYDYRSGARIYKRDRNNHASPNSARTESVCAGALNIQLAGDASYFGVVVSKPTIGDDIRPVEAKDIIRANRLMYWTAALALVIASVLHLAAALLI